jgi:hypothetical protein
MLHLCTQHLRLLAADLVSSTLAKCPAHFDKKKCLTQLRVAIVHLRPTTFKH